ncbi:luc7 3 isoform X3 [Sigmodon hispidus]
MKVDYERDFLRYLLSFLAEVECRIRQSHARLALFQNQKSSGAAGPTGKNEEKSQILTDKIDVLLQQIEELGSEGKVPETIKDHGVRTEGKAEEVEMDEEAEAMTDQKENIVLAVGIEESQKAKIESHINTGTKVGTENKTESPRKKKRRDLMI